MYGVFLTRGLQKAHYSTCDTNGVTAPAGEEDANTKSIFIKTGGIIDNGYSPHEDDSIATS